MSDLHILEKSLKDFDASEYYLRDREICFVDTWPDEPAEGKGQLGKKGMRGGPMGRTLRIAILSWPLALCTGEDLIGTPIVVAF